MKPCRLFLDNPNQHILHLMHMQVHASAVQRGSKLKWAVKRFLLPSANSLAEEKRRSNGAARCLARWNQSRRAERINEEKRSETYRSVASTSPFSSSGDSDRSDCGSLKSGRCRVTSAPIEGFIIVVTENKTDIFMSLICFYWLNQWAEHKGKNFGVMESYNLFYYFCYKTVSQVSRWAINGLDRVLMRMHKTLLPFRIKVWINRWMFEWEYNAEKCNLLWFFF